MHENSSSQPAAAALLPDRDSCFIPVCFVTPASRKYHYIAQVLQHRNIFAVDVIFVAFGIRISLSEEIGMQQFDILE